MGESHIEGPCVYWIGSNVRILGQSWQVEWGRGSRRAAAHPDSSYVCVHALKLSGASSFSPAAPPHSSSLSEAGDPAGTLLNTAAPRHSLVSPTWDRKKKIQLILMPEECHIWPFQIFRKSTTMHKDNRYIAYRTTKKGGKRNNIQDLYTLIITTFSCWIWKYHNFKYKY